MCGLTLPESEFIPLQLLSCNLTSVFLHELVGRYTFPRRGTRGFLLSQRYLKQRRIFGRGGKNTHVQGHPWVKSVTGTRQVSTGTINVYLTNQYYMDTYTESIVPIPNNKLSKLLKYPYISYLILLLKVATLLKKILPLT